MALDDGDVLVSAAYLHDIWLRAVALADRVHPLDGAVHLRELGDKRLADLVAYHSGAEAEARLRGLDDQLAEFDRERSEVADALTYFDLTTAPDGSVIGLEDRLAGTAARYDADGPVVPALRAAQPEIHRTVDAIEAKLARAGRL